jgi:predicted ATP-dependent endonuclease of OLD family
MQLSSIFIRFYKSFNYDRKREAESKSQKQPPWEVMADGRWFPYIQVPIDPKITTVVGANESGKSHLLSAIEKAISGEDDSGNKISLEDLCRYSPFFSVQHDKSKLPDFGCEWSELTEKEQENVKKSTGIQVNKEFRTFLLFRTNGEELTMYLSEGEGEYLRHEVKLSGREKLLSLLPRTFRIYNNIALPGSVPIKQLVRKIQEPQGTRYELLAPKARAKLHDLLDELCEKYEKDLSENENKEETIYTNKSSKDYFNNIKAIITTLTPHVDDETNEEELELAYKLICKIAQVNTNILLELSAYMMKDKKGYTNGYIDMINKQIAAYLNFPDYWVQDKQFCLLVSATEHDLVFTIRDKTGTQYSFSERSNGLRFFLSYFIQCRSHEPQSENPEILLMDEPDTYLSSQGQQDLLKIFEELSNPRDGRQPIQIVYVTHSPFLIDKNHSERIRVLDKGDRYEGTQVIKSNAQNHYEPLRSAFGAFVGETVFIGNCNLMVEGASDQILIAGAANYLRSQGASERETLDLNQITVVPAGGASQIPYLVYLARGRDANQPAVIVLLDSDKSGNDAKIQLTKKGYGLRKKPPLKEEFVLQIADLENLILNENISPVEIEDLIPLPICIVAAQKYAQEICQAKATTVEKITEANIIDKLINDKNKTIFDALLACFEELSTDGLHLEKIGFARNVVELIAKLERRKEGSLAQALKDFENNFKILFRHLDKCKRTAERKLKKERASQQADSIVQQFIDKHPLRANRGEALAFIEEIEELIRLEETLNKEVDTISSMIQNIKNSYKLETAMGEPIEPYKDFLEDIEKIKYAGRNASEENQGNKLDGLENGTSSSSSPEKETINKSKRQNDKQRSSKPTE